jgi:hypothetical protein
VTILSRIIADFYLSSFIIIIIIISNQYTFESLENDGRILSVVDMFA